jgi:hypothetical protein
MRNRGQGIAIDLFLGVAIFLLLLTAVLAIWSNTETTASKELTEKEMQQMAEDALDRLLRSQGEPANWEQPNAGDVTAIGLARADRILDENKVKQLDSGGINRGLIAYYKLNENADDSSGNNNNGTPFVTSWEIETNCKSNSCAKFNGIDNYVDIEHTNLLQQSFSSGILTVTAWINPTAFVADKGIVSKSKGFTTEGYFDFKIGSTGVTSKLALNISNGSATFTANSADNSLSPSQWQHVAVTLDGTNIKFFVNGAQSGTTASETYKPASTTDSVKIGRAYNYSGYTFSGLMDEVRIYNRALSANEIKALSEDPRIDMGASAFVKQKLLIGDNNYFFRIMDRNPSGGQSTIAESGIDPEDPLPGIPEEQRNELIKKLMQTKISRAVIYVYNDGSGEHQIPAVAELTLHRVRG